jgi:hypothetical protein
VQFDVGWYSDGSADTPDLLETSIDKPEYAVRRHHGGVGQCAHGRQADHQRARRPPADDADHDVKEGTAQVKIPVGKDWGTGAYVVATLRRPLDAGRAADAGPRDRPEMVRHRQEDPHAAGRICRRRRWCGPAPR